MSSKGDKYMLARGVSPSIRLLAQHWLWKDQFGWNLHPDARTKWRIEEGTAGHTIPRMIADVATGNAIWMIEESSNLPPGSECVGFDISKSMTPSPHTLPANTSLSLLDMTAEIPPQYHNAFDVVHIRLVIGAVYDNDPRPILRNMIRMLKPGGMLQWGEIMLEAYVLGKPQDDRMTASKRIMAKLQDHMGTTQVTPEERWLRRLPTIFEECGLQNVQCIKAGEPRKEMWRYWGDVMSGAVEEVVAGTGVGAEHLPELQHERDRGDYVYVEPRIVTGWKEE